jgi:xanthine dehydrogenase large subunit
MKDVKIVGRAVPHESACGHVTGEALYADDLQGRFPRMLHAWPVPAPHAHARLLYLDASPALAEAGVCTTPRRLQPPAR